jgi:hypothetical protein
MDELAPQINEALARWGDAEMRVLPGDDRLASEERWLVELLSADPPDYQAGRLTVARGRVAQARRMSMPGATVYL